MGTDLQYQAVYNVLSFALASMMATTMFLWFRSTAVKDQFKSAVLISGLVTFIAAYHYIRIFNSWVDAYHYSVGNTNPVLTGVPFNDAYRYMDWLLTVPLLLIEILLVMKLSDEVYSAKAWTLGFGSALMIISGYYGELVVTGDLTPRWMCWFLSMTFFLYIVYELLVGLAEATNGCQIQDPVRAGHDGDQLVHISRRLSDPHAGAQQCCTGSGWHSDWLLRFRYHLKVWRWVAHLSDHICEVRQAVSVGVIGICHVFSSAVTSAHGFFSHKDNSPRFG